MSSGANIGDGGPDGIGDAPTDMGVWELFQLGWLNAQGNKGPFYDVAYAGEKSQHRLSDNVPATRNGVAGALHGASGQRGASSPSAAPSPGDYQFYSGQGNDLNNTMTKTGITGHRAHRQGKLRHRDRLGLRVPRGLVRRRTTWTPVTTNLSDTAGDQSGFNTPRPG